MCDCDKKQKRDKKCPKGKGRRARVVETTVCTYNNACSPFNQCNQIFSACGCGVSSCRGGCGFNTFNNGCGDNFGCGERFCGYRPRCETNWGCGCGVASCGGGCGFNNGCGNNFGGCGCGVASCRGGCGWDSNNFGGCGCGVASCGGGCGWNRWNDCGSRIYWNQEVRTAALGCNTGCYGGVGLYGGGLYGGAACGVNACGRRW